MDLNAIDESTQHAVERAPALPYSVAKLDAEAPEGPGSITALLHLAVEKGTPVAELKELVALHKELGALQAIRDFAAAMAAFQSECPPIKKSSTATIAMRSGGSYSFKHAELDEIARTVNPILFKNGLSYTWDSKGEKDMLTVVCTVRHAAGHSVSSSLTLPVENPSAMNLQQKYGAALTFASRRTLSSVLGLTTTDDEPAAAGVDPTKISEDQALFLNDLIKESGANLERFLKYFEIGSVADLRATEYERAVTTLQQRKDRKP